MPEIRAAKEWGQRPTATIVKDAWYGHRDYYWQEFGDKDEFITWDYALISALQVIEDLSDQNGLLSWQTEPEWVDVVAKKKINKFQASIDRATKGSKNKPYEPEPGETWVPEIEVRSGRGLPTYQEYLEGIRNGVEEKESSWGENRYGKSWEELQREKEDEAFIQ